MNDSDYEHFDNGFAHGRFGRNQNCRRICVLWLSANTYFEENWAGRLMMFFGLPVGPLLTGARQFLTCPIIPLNVRFSELAMLPVKAVRFVVMGQNVGLLEYDIPDSVVIV